MKEDQYLVSGPTLEQENQVNIILRFICSYFS